MPKVLTEGSTIVCPHQGKVKFTASQQALKVNRQAVLVADDVKTGTVSNCQNPTDPSKGLKKCTKVLSMNPGSTATKLKVGKKPVLVDTATGLTDGLPLNTWTVQSAVQTKLDAF